MVAVATLNHACQDIPGSQIIYRATLIIFNWVFDDDDAHGSQGELGEVLSKILDD